MEVKRVTEELEIWNKEEKAEKLEEEAKKLVSLRFYKLIYILERK